MVDKGSIKAIKKSCSHPVAVLDEETGEIICSKCGQVLSKNQISYRKQRIVGEEDYLSQRTGPPSSLRIFDKGLSTEIGTRKDYRGKSFGPEQKRISRLRFWNARLKSRGTSTRSLRKALMQIEDMRAKMSLPASVAENAAKILREAQKQKLSIGRSISLLAAASMYAACRQNNIPRNLTEIARVANVNRKSLSKMYRDLSSKLELKFEPFEPTSFIGKIASKLKINVRTQRDAIMILNKASKAGVLSGKRPVALAAAALYLACIKSGTKVSQKKISDASKISQPTIKKLFRLLAEL